jgi:SAM-dependent methyltransferase
MSSGGLPGQQPASLRCHAPQLRLACPVCGAGLAPAAEGLRCPACAATLVERDGILACSASGVHGGRPGFDPHFFPGLAQVEERHFWFRARRRLIRERLARWVPDLGQRALFDIGCGTGALLAFLERAGVPLAGACDAYAEGLRLARARVRAPLLLVSEDQLPPLAAGQSLLALFDVLEHIDDDRAALAWLASVLAPGGVLVLTVPAHPFLFDENDRVACHRRRYTRPELLGKLRQAGLEPLRVEHFMAALVLPRVASRLAGFGLHKQAGKLSPLSVIPVVNELAYGVLELERRLTRWLRAPFGTSLLAIAVRR